jgi:DNA-binding beta-propeller fold protein YncE
MLSRSNWISAAVFVIFSLLALWHIPDMFGSQQRRNLRPEREPSPGGRRVALVVGNAAYEGVSPLKNPENDARDIGQLLNTLGFQTEIAVNVNRRSLEQSVDRFANNLQPGDVGLFYFSGHGLQLSGENYLVPVDFKGQHEADVKYEAYPASQVLDLMGEKRARLRIIILDACRNNPYRSLRSTGGGLAQMSGTGAYVAFAAEAGKTAEDGTGRNGLFTKHLLAFMSTPGLELEDVFKRVRESVYMDSGGGQTPFTDSGVIGDFYFRLGAANVPDNRVADRTALAVSDVANAASGYHVLREIKIGGEGGWDNLTMDSAARRLYISHATHVVVVDVEAAKIVGDIPDTPGVHGIAIAPELNRGFTSNGQANTMTMFDLKSLKPIGRPVTTGDNPDAINYDSVTGRVMTFNRRSKNASVIDPKTGNVIGMIPTGGMPGVAVADGKGKVYANVEDTNEVVEIDPAKATVSKRYSIKPCDGAWGLAMDTRNRRLFSSCGNSMMIVSDPDAGRVLASLMIGSGATGVVFDPATGYAISSNGDGTLTIVQQARGKYDVLENVATERGARTIAIDEKTHNVYLPVAKFAPAQRGQRATAIPDSFRVLVVGK